MEEHIIRLNKFLSEAGVCSRREADRLAEAGRIQINGKTAKPGDKVDLEDLVTLDGQLVQKEEEKILLAFHKPRGIVCTAQKKEPNNLMDYLKYPKRITYAGRLDKDSEGLLILTNQGDLIQKMMRARAEHEKEYVVTVDKPVTESFAEKLRDGIWLEELGVKTRTCKVEISGKKTFHIILTQGINRQIRRMCQACGYHVKKLVRIRILNIQLGDLEKGRYRSLTDSEISTLYQILQRKES